MRLPLIRLHRALALLVVLYITSALSTPAQVTTGTPPFGSFSGGPDVINNANLNAHWTIPVLHKPGRGANFTYDLTYDSSVWYSAGTTWQPVYNYGWRGVTEILTGYISYSTSSHRCLVETQWEYWYVYSNWTYHDAFGVAHKFNISVQTTAPDCGVSGTEQTAYATDGSGYYVDVVGDGGPSATLNSSTGTLINAPLQMPAGASSFTDRNGNQINVDSSGHFYDTLSSTIAVLTVSGTAPSNTTFTYTPPSGTGSVTYTMSYVNYTVATNFAVSGITEYPAHAVYLVDKVALPDGTFYQFTYEQTPGTPTSGACTPLSGTYQSYCVTARVVKVSLPAGGYVAYSYSGGAGTNNSGIWSDGTAATVTHTLNDGTTSNTSTYAHSESGTAWTTLITDTQNNQTNMKFQSIYETERDAYQGSTSGTLLVTTYTCYNGSAAPCNSTAVTLPITQRDVLPTIPSASSVTLQSKHTTKYNSVGGLIESDDYAFGSGAFGVLLRQTLITYASLPPNITSFRQTVTVKNGSGTVLAQTNYNYDQGTLAAAPTGTPQLAGVSGSRGNLTAIQRCTNLTNCSTNLQTTMGYDTAGQLQWISDPLSNGTSFSYTDNFLDDDGSNPPSKAHTLTYPTDAYVTSITPPLNGAITMKYYFYNGGLAQTTDQNNNKSWSHFDSIGRPSSAYGPTLPIAGTQNTANPWTLINYTSSTQIDTYTDINDSSATATTSCSVCRQDEVKVDGLGRAINTYLKSDPEGQTEVDTVYDGLGRVQKGYHPYRNTNDTTYGIETPTYDAIGRTIKVTHPDTTYSQAVFGPGVSGTGVKTSQVCSSSTYGLGYPSLFTDEAAKMREIWTDALGRTIEADEPDSTGALNSNTCYSYDPLGNLLQIVHGSQTRTYGYDTLSRVTSVTIPELGGCAVTYGYDNDSNLQTRTAPAPNQTSCTTTVTTTYYHDALNRLTKIAYGATSPVATPTAQYGYDATSLIGCATTPPTLTDSNPKGHMTSMCDGSGATSWAHDAAGRIITEKRTIQGTSAVTQTISYSYNLDSSIATVTYPSGKTVTYTVSNAQRLTAAKDNANSIQFATAASYSAPGGLSGVITGQISGGFGGITESHNYNKSLEYTSTKATSTAGTAMDLSVNYASSGDNGSITSITNNADNGRTQTFTYDPLNRILSAVSQNTTTGNPDCWGQTFGPDGAAADDAIANLTKINNGTQTPPPCTLGSLNATVDANNHVNTDSTYVYDAAGNMTKDGTGASYSYAFDAENRLVQANGFTSSPWCYVYDGEGLRVAKKSGANSDCSGGTVTKLYWRALSGDTLTETDGSGSFATTHAYNEYVFFAGRRIASRVTYTTGSTGIFYYFADQLGSTRTITAGSGQNSDGTNQTPGQLCYDQDYTPYGQEVFTTSQMTRLQTTACPPNYKFTGYERDSETGLDYAFARYYSSRLGRFLSTDPLGGSIGDLQSHNAYAYVTNNPLNMSDPSGLCGGPHGHPCPDGDGNPCSYGLVGCAGGGGSCGLDCLSGLGFADMLSGGGYAGYCPIDFTGCVNNGVGGYIGIEGNGIGYNSAFSCPELVLREIEGPCGFATLYLFGGPGSGSLRDILMSNPACADIFGGTMRALAILDAATQNRTDSPNWQPPSSYASPAGEYTATAVASNFPGLFAGVDFGTSGDKGGWNGQPFTVFTNANFSNLTPSQRKTAFFHELHHVALGDTLASQAIDNNHQYPAADMAQITKNCGTAPLPPPKY